MGKHTVVFCFCSYCTLLCLNNTHCYTTDSSENGGMDDSEADEVIVAPDEALMRSKCILIAFQPFHLSKK